MSTEEMMRIDAAHFVQLSSPNDGDSSIQRLPFGISLSNLTAKEIKNVELASLLLAGTTGQAICSDGAAWCPLPQEIQFREWYTISLMLCKKGLIEKLGGHR